MWYDDMLGVVRGYVRCDTKDDMLGVIRGYVR